MLAMNQRTPWGIRHPASSLTTIASMLAPTGIALSMFPGFREEFFAQTYGTRASCDGLSIRTQRCVPVTGQDRI
jgi:hypothetical protein